MPTVVLTDANTLSSAVVVAVVTSASVTSLTTQEVTTTYIASTSTKTYIFPAVSAQVELMSTTMNFVVPALPTSSSAPHTNPTSASQG
jgi:phage baseplate assembly protein gpV